MKLLENDKLLESLIGTHSSSSETSIVSDFFERFDLLVGGLPRRPRVLLDCLGLFGVGTGGTGALGRAHEAVLFPTEVVVAFGRGFFTTISSNSARKFFVSSEIIGFFFLVSFVTFDSVFNFFSGCSFFEDADIVGALPVLSLSADLEGFGGAGGGGRIFLENRSS